MNLPLIFGPGSRSVMAGDTEGGSGTIRWRLHLASAPEEVFRFLATDEGRARFWAKNHDPARTWDQGFVDN